MQTQLRDLEYFAAIAEHGQVQRAAAALCLSQPALSKSLRRLELSMNAKLLKRTPKGVELTSVGSALLARVHRLRLSLDDVTREIADLSEGRSGHLRIGMAAALAHIVPVVCSTMVRESPQLTLKLTNDDHPALMAGLRSGALDVAVSSTTNPPQEDLFEECLFSEESATIFSSVSHRLANRKHLTLADLARERWALPPLNRGTARLLDQAFLSLGLSAPKIAVETTNMMTRFRLVATSDLLTFSTKSVANYAASHLDIVALHVKVLSGTRRVCVTYRKDAYLPPAALRFIDMLKAMANNIKAKTPRRSARPSGAPDRNDSIRRLNTRRPLQST
jgi:DNA-binding transcriptional LysR family regulator